MPLDVLVLLATAVLAIVAVVAAVVATRASRRILASPATREVPSTGGSEPDAERATEPQVPAVAVVRERSQELAPRVVEGRIVVPPSRDELVSTALSRPQVRLTVLAHGLATALRPESRDRIAALVRREYRERRRHRLRAGRRASRAAHLAPTPPEQKWLGSADDDDQGRAIGA